MKYGIQLVKNVKTNLKLLLYITVHLFIIWDSLIGKLFVSANCSFQTLKIDSYNDNSSIA